MTHTWETQQVGRPGRRWVAAVAAMALAAGLGGVASADDAAAAVCDRSWAAGVSGRWGDPVNWSPAGLPKFSESVCISAPGTYTVSMYGARQADTLVVGGAGSSPTLRINPGASLRVMSGLTVEAGAKVDQAYNPAVAPEDARIDVHVTGSGVHNRGAWSIAAAGGLPSQQELWWFTGDFLNEGTITVAPGAVLAVWPEGVEWVNRGDISIGAIGVLSIHSTTGHFRHEAGTIHGPGTFWLDDAHFVQGEGTVATDAKVGLWKGDLTYEGDGSGVITGYAASWNSTAELTGAPAAGQTLRIVGTCDWSDSRYVATGDVVLGGVISLVSEGCSSGILDLNGHVLRNHGTLRVDAGGTNQGLVRGEARNAGTVRVASGATLMQDLGPFVLEPGSQVVLPYRSGSPLGRLSVAWSAALNGALRVLVPSGVTPPLGESHRVLDAAAVSGSFSPVNSQVTPGASRYFQPRPDATGLTLTVRNAAAAVTPTSAKRGAALTVSGANLPPGATATVVFIDHAGTRRTIATALVAVNGSLAATGKVPTAAALGAGKVEVRTTIVPLVLTRLVTVVP